MISYEECVEITKKNKNFYEKVEMINGYKVSVFNYILSIYPFFLSPFENAPQSARELRGLTFVHYEGKTARFLMLDKFFNINEVAENSFDLLKDLEIAYIQDKADGSMMRFIRLPDGSIIVKTKNGFQNDQCLESMKIYNKDSILQNFVKETLDQGLAAIFEFTSPNNKIVLNYNESTLLLIQLRDESNGKYLGIYDHSLILKYPVKKVKAYSLMPLDYMMTLLPTLEDVEGFVVTFKNGHKVKLKTKWYFDRHRVLDNSSQEDSIVEMVLQDKLDDAISILDKTNERRMYAESIQLFLSGHIQEIMKECQILIEKSLTYQGDRKRFAIDHLKDPMFHLVSYSLDNPHDTEKLTKNVKGFILHKCRRLDMSKKYLSHHGFKVLNFQPFEE
jgi:T4 RnlA family RNA ligase